MPSKHVAQRDMPLGVATDVAQSDIMKQVDCTKAAARARRRLPTNTSLPIRTKIDSCAHDPIGPTSAIDRDAETRRTPQLSGCTAGGQPFREATELIHALGSGPGVNVCGGAAVLGRAGANLDQGAAAAEGLARHGDLTLVAIPAPTARRRRAATARRPVARTAP